MGNTEKKTAPDLEAYGPAAGYVHDHPPVRNINSEYEKALTIGQRVSDRVADIVGSWPFIIVQSFVLAVWIATNVYLAVMIKTQPGYLKAWDPYPFILLNLVLSFQAAYTGPVVMMSQNRQSFKDRLMAQHDFEINKKAEEEIGVIMEHLTHQDKLILSAISRLEALKASAPQLEVLQKLEDTLQRVEENDRQVVKLIKQVEDSAGG